MKLDNKLLMIFIDESDSFAMGFECGMMWQKMDAGEPFDKYIFHMKNEMEVAKMCRRFHYEWKIGVVDKE